MYLDQLNLLEEAVGYGTLGLHGLLGYEGSAARVQQRGVSHALSAHAPSRLVFALDGRFDEFRCQVALNDDVAARDTSADFVVYADGRVVAAAPYVRAGDSPREVRGRITGADRLMLITQTTHWPACHSLWLDPEVEASPTNGSSRAWSDCLKRVRIDALPVLPRAERCIATVASSGYAHLLDDLLGSLKSQRLFDDTLVVVFNVNDDAECARVINKYGAHGIPCQASARKNSTLKAVLYSVASLVDANHYICLDADTLVLDDVRRVFEALDAHAPDSILIARDAFLRDGNLLRQLCTHYRGEANDLSVLLGRVNGEGEYPFIVNDGVFAGSRRALLGIDSVIRNMAHAVAWMDYYPDHGWRNQFIFNLALAYLRCATELDPRYNLQLHMHDVQLRVNGTHLQALWRGREVPVLHFCGWGRNKYPEWRGRFARGALQ